jgi:hypothetical protein
MNFKDIDLPPEIREAMIQNPVGVMATAKDFLSSDQLAVVKRLLSSTISEAYFVAIAGAAISLIIVFHQKRGKI